MKLYRQVGNAVPVNLAKAVAQAAWNFVKYSDSENGSRNLLLGNFNVVR